MQPHKLEGEYFKDQCFLGYPFVWIILRRITFPQRKQLSFRLRDWLSGQKYLINKMVGMHVIAHGLPWPVKSFVFRLYNSA